MEKVYIIVRCCSGADYDDDNATVLFATKDYKQAKNFFDNEISDWKDGMTEFDSNYYEYSGETKLFYECCDIGGDSHMIMKLVEKEI